MNGFVEIRNSLQRKAFVMLLTFARKITADDSFWDLQAWSDGKFRIGLKKRHTNFPKQMTAKRYELSIYLERLLPIFCHCFLTSLFAHFLFWQTFLFAPWKLRTMNSSLNQSALRTPQRWRWRFANTSVHEYMWNIFCRVLHAEQKNSIPILLHALKHTAVFSFLFLRRQFYICTNRIISHFVHYKILEHECNVPSVCLW